MIKNYSNPAAETWYRTMLADPGSFPFFFTYGGVKHHGFSGLALIRESTTTTDKRETTENVWAVDENLAVTLAALFYPAYGVSEWTVWFENIGGNNTKVLSDLYSEVKFTGENPVLKGILGDYVLPTFHDHRVQQMDSLLRCQYQRKGGRATLPDGVMFTHGVLPIWRL